jgi:hypothetical protein
MNVDIEQRVKKAAHVFRSTLDAADKSKLPVPFQRFPRGSCGAASEVLGHYLRAMCEVELIYVCGNRGSPSTGSWLSHAWLENDGLIIDVTADQFDESLPRVVVTRDRSWHNQFIEQQRHPIEPDEQWWSMYGAPVLSLIPRI